jgi:hypothetical protein
MKKETKERPPKTQHKKTKRRKRKTQTEHKEKGDNKQRTEKERKTNAIKRISPLGPPYWTSWSKRLSWHWRTLAGQPDPTGRRHAATTDPSFQIVRSCFSCFALLQLLVRFLDILPMTPIRPTAPEGLLKHHHNTG